MQTLGNLFLLKKIYFERERERKREGEVEAGSLLSREPNSGLDPRTLGLRLEPKADT